MNRKEFIGKIVERANIDTERNVRYTRNGVSDILNAAADVLADAVENGEEVVVLEGLKVGSKEMQARNGHNPKTGEAMVIPAHKKLYAKFGTFLKSAIQ
jgi:nucleoid DNA-binding protein